MHAVCLLAVLAMHFSIPKTQECRCEKDGSLFVAYNIHINGMHFCTVRYKQLRHLHDQLRNLYGPDTLSHFPSKKLLPLSPMQTEERRIHLEKYIQSSESDSRCRRFLSGEVGLIVLLFASAVSQDQRISGSPFFHSFLRLAQSETHLAGEDQSTSVRLNVTLPGDEILPLSPVLATEETSSVIKVDRQSNHFNSIYIYNNIHFILR